MSALKEAERKINDHNWNFVDLPADRMDPVWTYLLNSPYNLSCIELSALKNARCSPSGISLYSP